MATESKSPALFALLLAASLLLYLFTLANALPAPSLESIDQGVAAIYALFGYILLWLLLLALLLTAMVQGVAPDWVKVGALLLHVLAAAGTVASIFIAIDKYGENAWLLFVLVLTPFLTAGLAVGVRFRGIATEAGRRAAILVGVVVAASSLIPLGIVIAHQIERVRHRHDPVAVYDKEKEQRQWEEDYVARFQTLGPDSPLKDYLDYLTPGSILRGAATAKASLVKTRQADAEALLKGGMGVWLERLWQLDLQATPALCTAMSDHLKSEAAHYRENYDYDTIEDYLAIHLDNMKWLVREHCDLGDALAAVDDAAQSYPSSPRRDEFVAAIEELRKRN